MKFNGENSSKVQLAPYSDASFHQLKKLSADPKPQACATKFSLYRFVCLLKRVEELLLVFIIDTNSSVLDYDLNLAMIQFTTNKLIVINYRGSTAWSMF